MISRRHTVRWFDDATKWVGKQACGVGLHAYEWEYEYTIFIDSKCNQTGTCRRCNATAKRVVHQYEDWNYESSDSCKLVRKCSRCSHEIEGNIKHIWGEWIYSSSSECTTKRYCTRNKDHVENDSSPTHVWGDWRYLIEGSCDSIRQCKRNADHKEHSVRHIFGAATPIYAGGCMMANRCTRCPKGINIIGERHDFLSTERRRDGSLVRRCRNCTHTEDAS